MVISMIAVCEQTGGLDEMLSKIADFHDEEVDAAASGLSARRMFSSLLLRAIKGSTRDS
jgi:type II secretory pathway component PulF